MKGKEAVSVCPLDGEDMRKMNDEVNFLFKDITEQIIACAIEVHSNLGPALLETVYEEALAHEFSLQNITFERQKEINLNYKGHEVGKGRVDFFVLNEVILELKAVESMNKVFDTILLTYLKALEKKVGLPMNFNVFRLKDGIKRLVL